MQKTLYSAFTLIELLIVITIITIIAFWITQVSFNTIWDKQKLDTTITKIVSNIETVRSNALMWKWIWTDLTVPESYQIDFSTTWSGNILTRYLSWTLETYNDISDVVFWTDYTGLESIRCLTLNQGENAVLTNTQTWTIIMKWSSMELSWDCTTASSKILELTIKRKQFTKTIQINTLNGLIRKD